MSTSLLCLLEAVPGSISQKEPRERQGGMWVCAAAASSRQSVLLEPTTSFGTHNNSKVIASPLVPLFLDPTPMFAKFMSDKRTAW